MSEIPGSADGGPQATGARRPLTLISGSPRERGRMYGRRFKEQIHAFLNREICGAFSSPKAEMLAYAAACGPEIKRFSPIIHDELKGMAEGAGLRFEEILMINLYEEISRGVLPHIEHCTAVAAGAPETSDGGTYVGQTWDWMASAAGLSSMLYWKRSEGPSVLTFSFPGLWVCSGLNSAGLALSWTSTVGVKDSPGVRVGIPTFVLCAHLLYQEDLDAVEREAKRAKNAGYFTFVMADGAGRLCNIEGSPGELIVERSSGRLARIGFGSKRMTNTAEGARVELHPRCDKMYSLLEGASGKITRQTMQHFLEDPDCGISGGALTLDMLVYDTTRRQAWLSRGPHYGAGWTRYTFDDAGS